MEGLIYYISELKSKNLQSHIILIYTKLLSCLLFMFIVVEYSGPQHLEFLNITNVIF